MTLDIEVAVQFALDQTGKPYCTHRPIQEYSYCYDCSALVVAGLRHMCSVAGVPSIVPDNVGNTVDLYRWGLSIGGIVPVAKGVAVRGSIFIKGRTWGYGPAGHTAYSLGGGYEMAAHGYRSGIHPSSVYDGRNYQDALIIPGVFYKDLQPPVDPKVLQVLMELKKWQKRVSDKPLHEDKDAKPDRPLDTRILKDLLLAHGLLDPRYKEGNIYGPGTAKAVLKLKRRNGIHPFDGRFFGSRAAAALLATH